LNAIELFSGIQIAIIIGTPDEKSGLNSFLAPPRGVRQKKKSKNNNKKSPEFEYH
jgi:hypothetical protein